VGVEREALISLYCSPVTGETDPQVEIKRNRKQNARKGGGGKNLKEGRKRRSKSICVRDDLRRRVLESTGLIQTGGGKDDDSRASEIQQTRKLAYSVTCEREVALAESMDTVAPCNGDGGRTPRGRITGETTI